MRRITANDYRERLNRVLVHIGDNMDQPLSLACLAEIACFSPFHFHRIFAAHVGETLHDHVRRLRLERAAQRLIKTGENITDIALAAGYETATAFARAFREHFGRTPTEFRDGGNAGASVAQSGAQCLTGHEGPAQQPVLRRVLEQRVLFVRRIGAYGEAAAAAWQALMAFAYSRRLMTSETQLIGISHDDPNITCESRIRYDACITVTGDARAEGDVGIQSIAGGSYAVFLHRGPYEGMGATLNSIFSQWLPASGKRLREVPCFERYLNRDPRRTKPENLRTECWVPIA